MSTLLIAFAAVGLVTTSAAKADEKVSLEILRAESLQNPTDYDKSLAYVRAALSARDYEAAIVVLERLLFYNPSLSGVRFELGNLYARLGAHAMAVHYYETALAAKGLNEETRIRAETYLALSRKELSPDRFSGSLQFGYQYRTNPASLPPDYSSFLFDNVDKYKNGGRSSFYALGQLNYRHDFQTGRGDQFEADAQAYLSRQFEFSELDFGALPIKAGPRIVIVPNSDGGITLRPYVVADQSWLDSERFTSTYGGGASFGIPVGHWFRIEPGFEWRQIDTNLTNPENSSVTLNSGTLEKAYVDLRWLVADGITIFVNAYTTRNGADPIVYDPTLDLSSTSMGGTLSVKFEFAPPVKTIPFNWSMAPFINYVETRFDDDNLYLSTLEKRHDRMTRTGIQLLAPVTAQWSFVSTIDYRANTSNVDEFKNRGWSAMFGAMMSF